MWVAMSGWHVERGMGDKKRGRTIDRYREKHRQRTSIKALSVCCAQQPTHCKERRREGTGCPLKMGGRRGVRRSVRKTRQRSRPAERQWSDSEFNISSWWASGSFNPHMPLLLLQHFSSLSTSSCSPRSPPPQAAPVIGCPTVLNLVVSVSVCVCVYVSLTLCDYMYSFSVLWYNLSSSSWFHVFMTFRWWPGGGIS